MSERIIFYRNENNLIILRSFKLKKNIQLTWNIGVHIFWRYEILGGVQRENIVNDLFADIFDGIN